MEGAPCSEVQIGEFGMRANEEFTVSSLFEPAGLSGDGPLTHTGDLNLPAELRSREGMVGELWENLTHLFADTLFHVGGECLRWVVYFGQGIGSPVGLGGVLGVFERGCVAEASCSAEDLQVAAKRGEDVDTSNKIGVAGNVLVLFVFFGGKFDVRNADGVCVHLFVELDETT